MFVLCLFTHMYRNWITCDWVISGKYVLRVYGRVEVWYIIEKMNVREDSDGIIYI